MGYSETASHNIPIGGQSTATARHTGQPTQPGLHALDQVTAPRLFRLNRLVDESGVSGTGVVAEGVQFSSGKCVVAWVTQTRSVAVYDSLDDVIRIHGHSGKTRVQFAEGGTFSSFASPHTHENLDDDRHDGPTYTGGGDS